MGTPGLIQVRAQGGWSREVVERRKQRRAATPPRDAERPGIERLTNCRSIR